MNQTKLLVLRGCCPFFAGGAIATESSYYKYSLVKLKIATESEDMLTSSVSDEYLATQPGVVICAVVGHGIGHFVSR